MTNRIFRRVKEAEACGACSGFIENYHPYDLILSSYIEDDFRRQVIIAGQDYYISHYRNDHDEPLVFWLEGHHYEYFKDNGAGSIEKAGYADWLDAQQFMEGEKKRMRLLSLCSKVEVNFQNWRVTYVSKNDEGQVSSHYYQTTSYDRVIRISDHIIPQWDSEGNRIRNDRDALGGADYEIVVNVNLPRMSEDEEFRILRNAQTGFSHYDEGVDEANEEYIKLNL